MSQEEPGSPKTRSPIGLQSLELERRSKADPAAVARSMMCAKDSTGNVLFKSNLRPVWTRLSVRMSVS